MNMKSCLLLCCLGFAGCSHIQDLIACQPPQKSAELFSERAGWDHREVDDVRCSNDQLKAVQLARQVRETQVR